jgi:hypothetical protein
MVGGAAFCSAIHRYLGHLDFLLDVPALAGIGMQRVGLVGDVMFLTRASAAKLGDVLTAYPASWL